MFLDSWNKRIGAVLLIFREQERQWHRSASGAAAGVDPNTIRRIERGWQNYETKSLANYAALFGLTVEQLTELATLIGPLTVEQRDLLAAYARIQTEEGRDLARRTVWLAAGVRAEDQAPPYRPAAPRSEAPNPRSPDTSRPSKTRARRRSQRDGR